MRSLLLIAAMSWGVAAAAPRVTIELLPQVAVQGEAVTLGQVAHVWSQDLALLRTLVDLPLGRAPRAGQAGVVQREALARWVAHRAAVREGDVDWRGAEAARVARRLQQVKGIEIAAVAVRALREWLSLRGSDAHVEVRQLPRDVEVPPGQLRVNGRPLAIAQARTRMVVWVDVWCDGAFVRSMPVALDVSFSGAPLAIGLHPEAAAPLQQVEDAAAMRAPALVTRGGWATLRSSEGVVSLESRVEVLQDGRAGERVRVRQPGATAIVFARVLAAGQLELSP